eukprot:m.51608 g.51608  ORF g.51608 m.51608 type:complete len:72 (-) comp18175_c0_seq2:770-985(-)
MEKFQLNVRDFQTSFDHDLLPWVALHSSFANICLEDDAQTQYCLRGQPLSIVKARKKMRRRFISKFVCLQR